MNVPVVAWLIFWHADSFWPEDKMKDFVTLVLMYQSLQATSDAENQRHEDIHGFPA